MKKALTAATVLCFLAGGARGDWPQYRGPNHDNSSPEKNLMRSWPAGGPKVLWTVPLGDGYGSPAVRDGQVYVLDRVENARDVLRCLDLATGRELRRWAYDAAGKLAHDGSRSIPTVDEKYVFTIGSFGHIHCIDRQSHKPVWSRHLLKDFDGQMPRWGVAQSPMLHGSTLMIAPLSKTVGVAALDKATGKEIWRSAPLGDLAYVSPRIATLCGVEQVLVVSATRMPREEATRPAASRPRRPAAPPSGPLVRRPADWVKRVINRVAGVAMADGRVLWTYDGWRCANPIPSPTPIGDDRVFITGGYLGGSVMLKLRAGERFAVEVQFMLPDYGAQIPIPLLHEGHLYLVCNGNFRRNGLVCVDLDGNVKWKTALAPNLDRGHTLLADGLIYSMDGAKGILRLIEPSPEGYREISQVELLGGREIWAPMALVDGKLLIRDQTQMKCLDVRGPVANH